MNKKTFYILSTGFYIAILIIFEIVMYTCVGEDVLSQKGFLRNLWIFFPLILLPLTLLRDFIIKKMNDNEKKK